MLQAFIEQSSAEVKLQLLQQLEALNDSDYQAIIDYLKLATRESDHQ